MNQSTLSPNSAAGFGAAGDLFKRKPRTMAFRTWAIAALAAFALVGPGVPALAGIVYNVTNDLADQNGWSLAGTITLSGTGTFSNASAITAWDFTASKDSTNNRFANTLSGALAIRDGGTYTATSSVLSLSNNSKLRFYQPDNSGMFWANNYTSAGLTQSSYYLAFAGNELWNTNQFSPIVGGAWTLGTASSAVPEIDPAAGSSALSLVAGMLAMIEQRRRRAALVA